MAVNRPRLMTPNHPDWEVFIPKLGAAFPEDANADQTRAACGHSQERTKATLREIEGINVAASIDTFREHGGHCDCEVLLDFEDRWRADVQGVGPLARPQG